MENHRLPALSAIPIGLYEKALSKHLSWAARLAQAKQAGFDFMEMSVDDSDERLERLAWDGQQRGKLLDDMKATGMRIQSLSLSAHRRYPLGSRSRTVRQKALDILYRAIDLCVGLKMGCLLIAGSDVYYEESDDHTRSWFLENLEEGFSRASAAGVMLALENWDIRIDSLEKVMWYVDYFNSPWFQVYADIGNLTYAGKDLSTELEAARGHIAALHVKDTLRGQLRYVTPGEGQVPFVEAFAKLAEIGFQAPVVLELWTESLPNASEIAAQSGKFIRSKMEQGWQHYAETIKTNKRG